MTTADDLPRTAETIVIGGGIVGTSIAYHLTQLGHDGVVLLEQGELAGGTSWHAAGLVGRLRASRAMTQLNAETARLFSQLHSEVPGGVGWKNPGSLMLGTCAERMHQITRTAAMAEVFGVEAQLLGPDEIAARVPFLRTDDLLGGAFLPGDGRVDPQLVTEAMARLAEKAGARILTGVCVERLLHDEHRVTGVETASATITARRVVLACGMWSRALAATANVKVPLHPVEHHYVESSPLQGMHEDYPIVRDPDRSIYMRPKGDTLVLGAFQDFTKPWMQDPIPRDFVFQLLDPDWEHFAVPLASGRHRVPQLCDATFPRFVNGPESFTPDNNFILGDVPELRDLYLACGFNSAGIACSGGAGKALAEWIDCGHAPNDLWSVDVRRFGPWQWERSFLCQRVPEVVGLHYRMAWPNREFETSRDVLRSALYERLRDAGACFGSKMGWERPLFFGAELDYTFERPAWSAQASAEQRACRTAVALFDQTSFSKYAMQGPGALAALQHLCGGNIDVAHDRTVYTGMFNDRGTFESDLTVIRTGETSFLLITATGQRYHDLAWIRSSAGDEANWTIDDVTEARGVLGVMGPRARDLLAPLTESDLSHEAYPFGTAREIMIAGIPVRAVRLTYVGELGWELHLAREHMVDLYDALHDVGAGLGLHNAGHNAINALRLEKGYLAWGADISPDDTPLEAGLGFAIDWDKPGGFRGRDALLAQRERGLTRRIVIFHLQDPNAMLWGGEPILMNDAVIGYTTSGGYGNALGGALAAGYVPLAAGTVPRDLLGQRFAIRTNGSDVPATPHLRSPYDPSRERILC